MIFKVSQPHYESTKLNMKYRIGRVISFAIVPDQLNVIENILNIFVMIVFELLIDSS